MSRGHRAKQKQRRALERELTVIIDERLAMLTPEQQQLALRRLEQNGYIRPIKPGMMATQKR